MITKQKKGAAYTPRTRIRRRTEKLKKASLFNDTSSIPFTGNMDFFRLTLTPGTDVP